MAITWTALPRDSFASVAAGWLEEHRIDANVIATVLAAVRENPALYDSDAWAVARDVARDVVRDGTGAVVGVVMETAPHPPYLPAVPTEAAVALAELWAAQGRRPAGINGEAGSTEAFVRRWQELTRLRGRVLTAEGVHMLGELAAPSGVPGRVRAPDPAGAELVVTWLAAYTAEAFPGVPPPTDVAAMAARIQSGHLLLWEDGGAPVSLAGWRHPAAGVSRIGPVYTPPEHRRRGFAAAVTAAAARAALDSGARDVMLFTDLANPTSNGVYARLGFRRVGEGSRWTFEE